MSTTVKLYGKEPYATEFTATVVSMKHTDKGYEVVLDQTLFFPEEGGQSPDIGVIDGNKVIDVQIKNGEITHLLENWNEVCTKDSDNGRVVSGKIDWKERFSNMQNHTGEHILSGIIHKMLGYDNVGFHLSAQSVTMDMNGPISPEQLIVIEETANQAVYDNVDVTAEYMDHDTIKDLKYRSKIEIDGPVRIVTIPGYDVCACCAPHVKKTGEIGLIKILRAENYKGGTRLTIAAGSRALHEVRLRQTQIMEVSQYLSAKPECVMGEIKRLQDEIVQLKNEMNQQKLNQITKKAESISAGQKNIYVFEEKLDSNIHRSYVNLLLEKCEENCAVFAGDDQNGYRFIIGSKTDARPVNQLLREKLGAKGGGKPEMVQGSVNAAKEAIQAVLEG